MKEEFIKKNRDNKTHSRTKTLEGAQDVIKFSAAFLKVFFGGDSVDLTSLFPRSLNLSFSLILYKMSLAVSS